MMMTLPTPYWQSDDGRATLYCGDCLELLPLFDKVDAIITDPPYGINTKSDGMGKLSPWADLCNSAYWYAAWLTECRNVLKSHGCVWSFLNWRSLVTFQKAACDIRWAIESLMVWDKCWIGPGGDKGLRPSYEMVALWAMPDFAITDRSLPDVQRFPSSSHKTYHPAEKPLPSLEFLVNTTRENGVVLDPFAGSATTGIACLQTHRRFIGIEASEQYAEVAARRLAAACCEDGGLFDPKAKHRASLFEGAAP